MSVFSIGALVGALLSGLLSDFAGRKVTVFIGASLYVLGGTIQTSSFYLWSDRFCLHGSKSTTGFTGFNFVPCRMLFPGRIISGIGTGYVLCVNGCV